jgi:hypothetical protein
MNQQPERLLTRSAMMKSGVHQCRQKNKKGIQCRAVAQTGSKFCFFHDPAVATRRADARRAGGRARTRKLLLSPNMSARELTRVSDVVDLLGETVNQVRCGELDVKVANTVGYLSGILLTALEKATLEEKLVRLEALINSQASENRAELENYDFEHHTTGLTSDDNDQPETANEN